MDTDTSTNSLTFEALVSSELKSLFDVIDSLRLHGIGDFIERPQIVVCGDQSSGKSSVLETISRFPFARSDITSTRFAIEFILHRSSEPTIKASVICSDNGSSGVTEEPLRFDESQYAGVDIAALITAVIESAKRKMGLTMSGKTYSKDTLGIEVSGPGNPPLTLVDLPGLIHPENKEQSQADKDSISSLVESYINKKTTIVLAVVSALDVNNQIILSRVRKVDPNGLRTLVLITKPDKLYEGSESESRFLRLAGNSAKLLRLALYYGRFIKSSFIFSQIEGYPS
jgi:GTPase SAR1 family protein